VTFRFGFQRIAGLAQRRVPTAADRRNYCEKEKMEFIDPALSPCASSFAARGSPNNCYCT
jgi:hypothetical protein